MWAGAGCSLLLDCAMLGTRAASSVVLRVAAARTLALMASVFEVPAPRRHSTHGGATGTAAAALAPPPPPRALPATLAALQRLLAWRHEGAAELTAAAATCVWALGRERHNRGLMAESGAALRLVRLAAWACEGGHTYCFR
jgi:hypothetical protein